MQSLQVEEDGVQNSNANRKLPMLLALCLALCNQRASEHVACRGGALLPRRAAVQEVAVEVYCYHMPPSVLVVCGVQCKNASRARSCTQFWANARRWCKLPPPALGRRGSSESALLPRVLICLPAYFQWLSSLYVLLPALIC